MHKVIHDIHREIEAILLASNMAKSPKTQTRSRDRERERERERERLDELPLLLLPLLELGRVWPLSNSLLSDLLGGLMCMKLQ